MTVRIAPDYEASMAEARELIETAYRQAPNDINVLENAGVVWQNIGEKERALLALRRVVQLVPLHARQRERAVGQRDRGRGGRDIARCCSDRLLSRVTSRRSWVRVVAILLVDANPPLQQTGFPPPVCRRPVEYYSLRSLGQIYAP